MGTLYIDRKDLELKLEGKAITFYAGNKREGIVPLALIKRVIIVGNIKIETSILHKLASNNISVIFLTGKRLHFAGILHGRVRRNGLLRLAQYEKVRTQFALKISSEIVGKKLRKQAEFLRKIGDTRKALRHELYRTAMSIENIIKQVEEQPDIEILRGLEGSAASVYYKAFTQIFPSHLEFRGRVRRPPTDPVNALLSLTYTILHFEIVREIECIGLDPIIGYYHSIEYGRESLACDLVEPFRVDVDHFVYEVFKKEKLRTNDFTKEGNNEACYLRKDSRRKYFSLYESWAQQQRPLWREEVENLARRISDGADPLFE